MSEPAANFDTRPLRGICLVVRGNEQRFLPAKPPAIANGAGKFPPRPDARVFSESIPLFFIGRNRNGFWLAREAEGRTGGMFLSKHSALRFANKNGAASGSAIMFLAERFELDVENQGNPVVGWLDKLRERAARLIPDYPPPIEIRRKIFKNGEWT